MPNATKPKKARKCCLCASKIIERTLPDGLLLCPKHSRLCDDVVKLAKAQRKAHPKVTA